MRTIVIPLLFMLLPTVTAWDILYHEPTINAQRFNYNLLWIDGLAINTATTPWYSPLTGIPDAYSGQLLTVQLHPTSQFFTSAFPQTYWAAGITWPNQVTIVDICDPVTNNLLETFINNDYSPTNPFGTPSSAGIISIAWQDISNVPLTCVEYETVPIGPTGIEVIPKAAFFSITGNMNLTRPGYPGNYVHGEFLTETTTTRTFNITATPIVAGRHATAIVVATIPPAFNSVASVVCPSNPNTPCSLQVTLPKQQVYHVLTEDSAQIITVDSLVT